MVDSGTVRSVLVDTKEFTSTPSNVPKSTDLHTRFVHDHTLSADSQHIIAHISPEDEQQIYTST